MRDEREGRKRGEEKEGEGERNPALSLPRHGTNWRLCPCHPAIRTGRSGAALLVQAPGSAHLPPSEPVWVNARERLKQQRQCIRRPSGALKSFLKAILTEH